MPFIEGRIPGEKFGFRIVGYFSSYVNLFTYEAASSRQGNRIRQGPFMLRLALIDPARRLQPLTCWMPLEMKRSRGHQPGEMLAGCSLAELINDPLIGLVMKSDGVDRRELKLLLEQVARAIADDPAHRPTRTRVSR